MKLRKPLAAGAVATLAISGLAFGSAAYAVDGVEYVELADIANTDPVTDYNAWHFDEDHLNEDEATQAEESISIAAGSDVLIVKGNGNDADDAVPADDELAKLLDSVEIDADSTNGLTVQIPVRVDGNGDGWAADDDADAWSTLRAAVGEDGKPTGDWTTSQALDGVAEANGSAPAETFAEIPGIYPIAAGFLVQGNEDEVNVASFTAGDVTTNFFAEPEEDDTTPGGDEDNKDDETPATKSFPDVTDENQFKADIEWLAGEGITTGIKGKDGVVNFQPKWKVTREAMAAFVYRVAGQPEFEAPAVSPFSDVAPDHQFYKEITWAASEGITTGIKAKDATLTYQPKWKISREAMAAFMYRLHDGAETEAPAESPFVDVATDHQFYKEIAWMAETGLSTGIKAKDGSLVYQPKWGTSREAMAAFLHRADTKFAGDDAEADGGADADPVV